MCNKVVDYFISGIKFLPDWFVTSKMIKKLLTALFAGDKIFYFNEDSQNIVFSCNEMGILSVDPNNVSVDILSVDTNYDENDPETINQVRLLAGHSKFEKRKELKKIETNN